MNPKSTVIIEKRGKSGARAEVRRSYLGRLRRRPGSGGPTPSNPMILGGLRTVRIHRRPANGFFALPGLAVARSRLHNQLYPRGYQPLFQMVGGRSEISTIPVRAGNEFQLIT